MTERTYIKDDLSKQDEGRSYFETGGIGQDHSFYTGKEQFELEMEGIYRGKWLPIDHVSRYREKGQFGTLSIGSSSVLIMRGDDGIQAFHNFCTHRGYKLIEEAYGKRQSMVCIYHCWVFDKNGDLKNNNGTYFDSFFSKEENGLRRIRTEIRHGIIFINFSDESEDLDKGLGDFGLFASAYDLENLEVKEWKDYPVSCNWKLIVHNINESLHFPTAHKDLHKITDFDDAGTYDLRGDIVGAWQHMRDGYNSVSMSGSSNRSPIPTVPDGEIDRINWITILPNLLFGFTADYVMAQWVWPESESTCFVRHFWLFHPNETQKPGFSHEDVFRLWDKANYEDWELCERTHRGLSNPMWTPGQLSLDEEVVSQIDSWILRHTADKQSRAHSVDQESGRATVGQAPELDSQLAGS